MPPEKATAMWTLLAAVDNIYFWASPRRVQIVAMLQRRRRLGITQAEIAQVMATSESAVSRYWHYVLARPTLPSGALEGQVRLMMFLSPSKTSSVASWPITTR